MKILEVNKFNYVKGGADRQYLDLVTLLKSKGHEVAIFCMDSPKNNLSTWRKYFVSHVGYNSGDSTLWQKIVGLGRMFYSFEARNKIGKLLDDFQPDVVHLHNVYHQISYSILFETKKRNIPVIMTVHDYNLISPDREQYHEKVGMQYWKFLYADKRYSILRRTILVLRLYVEKLLNYRDKIDLLVAPSYFVKNKLIHAGIDQNKIVVLTHFIGETRGTDPEDRSLKSADEKYALYFGRIYREKGVAELMEMFRSFSGIKLYLAGEIEDGMKIIEDDRIKYLGYLNKTELESYIRNAQFCVSCSTLPETFGLIATEANVLGKPFIALNAGAFSEVIDQGKTGYICETLDEMKDMIKKISEGGMVFDADKIISSTKERFGQENYYRELMAIFKSLKNS